MPKLLSVQRADVIDAHEGTMVNVGKLVGAGSAEYYLEKVARGVEDYYLHAGEAPGMWHGRAAVELGLAGEVVADELMALLRGEHPLSGERLAQPQRGSDRVWGFDVTFRAPKSVSLLFALGEGTVPREVRSAHEVALQTALGYLDREAGFGRRRVEGAIRPVATSGFVAAAFQHRTSRAGDPLLHTHMLVANLVRGSDGRWGALDGRLLYGHAKTAGVLYQAELRTQLSRRLGVAWTPVRNGLAEIDAVPQAVIRAFSRRRQEITEHMRARGETSARAAQVATLETRRRKDRDISPEGLVPHWRSRAAALGFGPQEIAGALGRSGVSAPDVAMMQEAGQALIGPAGLTAHASSFTRRGVLVALADRLGPGASAAALEDVADDLLGHADVVTLAAVDTGEQRHAPAVLRREDGRLVPGPDEQRFTTRDLLDLERRLIDGAAARRGRARGTATGAALDAALATRPSLSDEQLAMCRRLLRGADGVQVVRGHAGTGKTYALDACRDAWEASGMRVIGCALSARAAAELQAGAGIVSSTLHRLLVELNTEDVRRVQWGFGGYGWNVPHLVDLDRRTVIVVDEAGMVGTRQLAALLGRAGDAGARVVLVGDDRQLPEIDAGGAFRALAGRLGALELTDNRRQESEWERDALRLMRDGHSEPALDMYTAQGRVVTGDSAEEVRSRLVADWWDAQRAPDGDPLMIALRRVDVRELNGRARELRVAAGEVVGPELPIPGGSLGVGDWVMSKRNDRRLGVRNGDRGTVTAVDVDAGSVEMCIGGRGGAARTAHLPREYVEAGNLTLAYALTAHTAQGMTARRAFVLGDDAAYREWGYTAMSRGREENRLYVVAGDRSDQDTTHGRGNDVRAALQRFSDALARSRGQAMVLDQGLAVGRPAAEERARLRTLSDSELVAELNRAAMDRLPDWPKPENPGDAVLHRAERQEQEAHGRLETAQHRTDALRTALGREGRLSRWRRGEDRKVDEAVVRSGEQSLPGLKDRWASAAAELAELRGRRDAHDRWQAEHGALLGEDLARGFGIRDELQVRDRRHARLEAGEMVRLEADPPQYVLAAVGERPDGAGAQRVWREAAAALDAHRDRYCISDPDRPLGVTPIPGRDDTIARVVDRTRLATAGAQEPRSEPTTKAFPGSHELDDLIAVVRQHDADRAAQRREQAADRDLHRHYDHHRDRARERSRGPSIGM